MPIKFKQKTAKIVDGENEIELYGLSLNDITQLVMINREAIEELFQQVSGRQTVNLSDAETRAMVMDLIQGAPSLVAHTIALSARALDQFDDIVEFPAGIQLECLMKVGELTFTGDFSLKKALALVLSNTGKSQSGKRLQP